MTTRGFDEMDTGRWTEKGKAFGTSGWPDINRRRAPLERPRSL